MNDLEDKNTNRIEIILKISTISSLTEKAGIVASQILMPIHRGS